MSYRPHPKYARTDQTNPSAWGTCDRCGMIGNLRDFVWERQWAGPQIINRRFLVHPHCYNVPNEQLRTVVLPPDPDPVLQARVEGYGIDEGVGLMVTSDRHALRVAIVAPGIPKRPRVSTGTTLLQTSF